MRGVKLENDRITPHPALIPSQQYRASVAIKISEIQPLRVSAYLDKQHAR